ncbi:hypothetical protein [Methylobacterium iners]|uniref:Uncharacterized protein n=1 Tax=Methylobacterium iners TaxID=418707 RepID=A0ABQ4RXA4_9HYPH|nr:hypothetical protein [Methylobacterium iners]GJD95020.1 hypothetical protein OCOJLMKI_2229 [Methylobacterium iners]
MQTKLMTLAEIALDRHITVEEAKHLVDRSHCPRIFKTAGTYYLL